MRNTPKKSDDGGDVRNSSNISNGLDNLNGVTYSVLMIYYLHLDAEMGGRELKYSLLTAYFMVTDADFKVLDTLYLHVKPDDSDYIVSAQGMACNKIDLVQHDKMAMPYKQAKGELYNFLRRNAAKGSCKLTPVGHGVRGDIDHVLDKLISWGSWEQHCTYHYIDTSVVLQYLRACGKLPMNIDGSVQGLAEYFQIINDSIVLPGASQQWHDAAFDTKMTAAVYKKMVELGKS